ncbi:MAG: hypothetical protein IJ516_03925, partial [Phascolarctobacterium sp.]|nr:hypothetical protein [Phascolarctobacterium sp.]
EMAQIVAKAMAKGANVDKLAAEFADELDTLGVRVAKLEKGADAVKITGQIRASYRDASGFVRDSGEVDKTTKEKIMKKYNGDYSKLRTRLFIKGAVNDDWTYTARLQNEQDFMDNDGEDTDVKLNWAYVSGKLGGLKVDAGRLNFALNTKTVLDNEFDGVKVAYGKDVKVTGFVGKAGVYTGESDDRVYAIDVNTKLAGVPVYATYYKADEYDQEIWNVGASIQVAPKTVLKAEWMNGDSDENPNGDDNGYVATLAYGGAKASAPGSWGLWATYYDQPANCYVKQTSNTQMAELPADWKDNGGDGYEGFEVGVNYALAKNIVAAVRYFDIEEREGKESSEVLWSEVVFTF